MSLRKYQIAVKKLERMERAERGELTDEDLRIIKLNIIKLKYLHKNSIPFRCPVMVYFHSKSKHLKCELEDVLNLIKSDAMKLESDYIRTEIKGDKEKIRLFIEKQKSFTPCGVFYGRYDRVDIRQLNGIILLENHFDDLSTQQIEAIRREPYTYAFFKQLEKGKFAILVKTKGMTSRNYEQYRHKLKEYYQKLIENDAISASYINRPIYLAHDKSLHLNLVGDLFIH